MAIRPVAVQPCRQRNDRRLLLERAAA